jgi:flagellin
LDSINTQRAAIGAGMNQLTYAADNLTNISANVTASRSTIMDTDYALASTQLAKANIIQQAATAMLAQANQQPQSVLALLK